jgi:heterotetrameric sarcosine oxidase gamma subunit
MTGPRYDAQIARLPMEALFEARGPADELERACRAAGLAWPQAMHRRTRDARSAALTRLGARRVIVRAPIVEETSLAAALDAAFAHEATAHCALVSDMYALFRVIGPRAEDVLRQGAPLDLSASAFPDDATTGTRLWDATVMIERRGFAPPAFDILVEASFADYLELWLRTAAGEETARSREILRGAPAPIDPA